MPLPLLCRWQRSAERRNMIDAGDLDGDGGGAFQGGEQDAAEGVSDGGAKAALERLYLLAALLLLIACSDSRVERSRSVSSTRRMNLPPWRRANAQLKSAVRAPPRWR